MKTYQVILLSCCLFLAACTVPVTYIGDKLNPTRSVEVFYSTHDVKRDYKVIGHFTCVNKPDQEQVKSALLSYAMTVGADAVIITGQTSTKDNQAAYVTADALKYN